MQLYYAFFVMNALNEIARSCASGTKTKISNNHPRFIDIDFGSLDDDRLLLLVCSPFVPRV